ncbi:MAG: polyprenyl synthetase family protein [Christensenellales bacterium]|jgi:geranylgeranyl diphosphate synthase type II
MSSFDSRFQRYISLTERQLEAVMDRLSADTSPYAKVLVDAMRYSLLSGGKRLRPVLMLAAYAAYHKDVEPALPFAAGLEMIHTYSLIHDDLPCMDDDALRRGKPTNHMVYGEAMALLAGDGLLNLAFEVMAESGHPRAIGALGAIATRSGSRGMIAGQTADITLSHQTPDAEKVRYIHQHKTADLFHAAISAGLILAGADKSSLEAGGRYAGHLGTAFQIVDDLLDLQGDAAVLGKETHKDAQLGKITWPSLVGLEQAKADAAKEISLAVEAASAIDGKQGFLAELARRSLNRVQ